MLKKSAWLLQQIGDKPLLVPRDGREAARALNRRWHPHTENGGLSWYFEQ